MISNKSLALAEMLNGVVLPPQSSIIEGLNNASVGGFPYTENYKEEIVEVTANEHTDVIELVSDKLATIIRQSLTEIKTFGLPMGQVVSDKLFEVLGYCDGYSSPEQLADLHTSIKMNSLDNAFFNSSLYPTQVENKLLEHRAIDVRVTDRLTFTQPTEDELIAFINSSNPEVVGIVQEYFSNEINKGDLLNPRQLFKFNGSRDSLIVDFGTINTNNGLNIANLLFNYVLLTKMKTTEDPVGWLVGGKLEDYREFVSLMWNGLTNYLIVLKDYCQTYRTRGLVINGLDTAKLKSGHVKGTLLLGCHLEVYFSDDVINKLVDEGISLREIIIGSLWNDLTNNNGRVTLGSDILLNANAMKTHYKNYILYLKDKTGGVDAEYFIDQASIAITSYINNNPVLNDLFSNRANERKQLLNGYVSRVFGGYLDDTYKRVKRLCDENAGELSGLDEDYLRRELVHSYFLSTDFVTMFLKECGCEMSSSILFATNRVSEKEDNLVNKRQNLTIALINEIVKHCF